MSKHLQHIALLFAVGATLANALPATTQPSTSPDVEVLQSKEITIETNSVSTLEDSEEKLLSLADLTDEVFVEQKVPEDDRGKRVFDFVQSMFQRILQPKPIVDTITEDEKYGNTGDTLGAVGRGIVGGSEAISNFINLAIEYPRNLFSSLAHRATEALNHLGSRLVGL